MTRAADAILEAMNALGGEADAREVRAWVNNRYPGRWTDITTPMADLTYPGNPSSTYPKERRFLERVDRARYRLRGVPYPILGDRFARAAEYATELHGRQARKGTRIPYVTHVFSVCALVLEDGGTEDEAIAALLHDGPEDQGGQMVLDHIRMEFGQNVAEIVRGLTDDMPALGEQKQPWRHRKEAYLATLAGEPRSVLRVSLADKLHNARSILIDLMADQPGGSVWDRFNAPKAEQAWYFGELLKVFECGLPGSRNLPEFQRVVADLFS